MLLSTDDITELRKRWLGDFIDYHPEFGASPTVAVGASAGADEIQITGLVGPTLRRGAAFFVETTARRDRYAVDADTTVAAGAATVPVNPYLVAAASAGATIQPEPYFKSIWNAKKRELRFTDADLQALADEAEATYGARIARASDPHRRLFQAIRMLAVDELLQPGSEFVALLLADDQRGTAQRQLDEIRKQQAQDESWLKTTSRGPQCIPLMK